MLLERGKQQNHLRSISLMFLFVVAMFLLSSHLRSKTYFPIKEVMIVGAHHVDHQAMQELISPLVKNGFFSVHLSEIRERIFQSPWVAHAMVQRVWPNQVFIKVVEKTPVARWNHKSLISSEGELFQPPESSFPDNLPDFIAPDGQQAEVLEYYKRINSLLIPLHFNISYLECAPASSWKMSLNNGITVVASHKDFLMNVDRFVKLYPKIVGDRASKIEYIDLRYSKGMAVKWKTVA